MGDDDKRELVPDNRTILHDVAEIDLAGRFGAGRPHRSPEGRAFGGGGHLDGPEAGGLRECRRE